MKTLAVHLHLYYLEQLPEMLSYLRSLEGQNYDLFVTMPQPNKDAEDALKNLKSDVKLIIVPNKGWDVGAFIEVLHRIDLDDYKYILKLHTKGDVTKNHTWLNGHRLDNKLWRHILLDALLKDKTRLQNNLNFMENNPTVGMLSSNYCIGQEKRTYRKLLPQINKALEECGFPPVNQVRFVAGTMFCVRAALLKPLLRYTLQDFPISDGQVKEGTFAHVMERLFGVLMPIQGYKLYGIEHDNYRTGFFMAAVKHFLYQKKITTNGYTIIKVCRIPVWHRKG